MRLVQATIPTGKRDAVCRALEDEGIDYVLTDETGDREYAAVAYFPLPANAVETVLDRLRRAGLGEESYTVVLEASTVVSRRFEKLEERYDSEAGEDRIAREELAATAEEIMPTNRHYFALTMISAVVATAGLLLDSAAVVVGSMVIAPLVGPALGASIGTVLDEPALRARGVALQALGLVAAIGAAAGFAALVQLLNVVPPEIDVLGIGQVRERFAPDFLALAIALGAGVAGALSLSTGVSTALVGVMIAVALIPPAAVVGIGIAWNEPALALGSAVLVLVNVLSINFAALAVLWYQGYRPGEWFRRPEVRQVTMARIAVLGVVIMLLSVFLGGVTYAGYQEATAERAIIEEAQEIADEHDQLSVLEVQIQRNRHPLRGHPEGAVVTIGKPEGTEVPQLSDVLQERIEERLGASVNIEVRLIEVQSPNPGNGPAGTQAAPAGTGPTVASAAARNPGSVAIASRRAVADPARRSGTAG